MSDDVEEEEESDGINITLGKLIAYPVGVALVLSGLAILILNPVAGILILLGGLLALPIVRSKIKAKQGIRLSRWATVAIVLVLVVAGGAMIDTSSNSGTEPVGSEGVDGEQQLIEKSPSDLVLQIEQVGSGWTKAGSESNETYAQSEFLNDDDSYVSTSVEKYDTANQAAEEYRTRVEEVQETYGTDSVEIGDEGILYSQGDLYTIIFRDANVVAEIQYDGELAVTPEQNIKDYAEMVQENFRG